MSPPSASVLAATSGGVATITLNRPQAMNAWTPEMGRELLAAVRRAAEDSTVRAVLFRGAGGAFSAGADLKNPRELLSDGTPDLSGRLREIYNPIVVTIRAMPKPAVAAVQGAVAGLGCSLALACDMVLASRSAFFLLAFVRLGVIPDAGAAYHLSGRVGRVRAAELAMLGDRLSAARALEWGLVNQVIADDELEAAAAGLAARLAEGPTVALANIKQVLDGPDGSRRLAEQLELETTLQQEHARTRDYSEGVRAFTEKRPPRFHGS